jgi:hypothetical protein
MERIAIAIGFAFRKALRKLRLILGIVSAGILAYLVLWLVLLHEAGTRSTWVVLNDPSATGVPFCTEAPRIAVSDAAPSGSLKERKPLSLTGRRLGILTLFSSTENTSNFAFVKDH